MRFAIASLFVIVVWGELSAAPLGQDQEREEPANAPTFVVAAEDEVEIRVQSKVVTTVERGRRLQVIDWSGPWVGVLVESESQRLTGWVAAVDIRLDAAEPSEQAPPPLDLLQLDVSRTHLQSQGLFMFVRLTNRDLEPVEVSADQFRVFAGTEVPAPLKRGYMSFDLAGDTGYRRGSQDFAALRLASQTTLNPGESVEGWLGFQTRLNEETSQGPISLQLVHAQHPHDIDLRELENRAIQVDAQPHELFPTVTVYRVSGRLNSLNIESLKQVTGASEQNRVVVIPETKTMLTYSVNSLVRSHPWLILAADPDSQQQTGRSTSRYSGAVMPLDAAAVMAIASREGGEARLFELIDDASLDDATATVILRELTRISKAPDTLRRLREIALIGSVQQRSTMAQYLATRTPDAWRREVLLALSQDSNNSIRARVIPLLAATRSNQFFQLCADAVLSEDRNLHQAGLSSLRYFPNERSLEILTEIVKSGDARALSSISSVMREFSRASISIDAIREFSQAIGERLKDADDATKRYLVAMLSSPMFASLPAELSDVMAERLKVGATVSKEEIELLGRLNDDASEEFLIRMLPAGPSRSQMRAAAAMALGKRKSQKAVVPLLQLLRFSPTDRGEAATALGMIGDLSALEPLRELFESSGNDAELRIALAGAIVRLGGLDILDELTQSNQLRHQLYRSQNFVSALIDSDAPEATEMLLSSINENPFGSSSVTTIIESGDQELLDRLASTANTSVINAAMNYIFRPSFPPEKRVRFWINLLERDDAQQNYFVRQLRIPNDDYRFVLAEACAAEDLPACQAGLIEVMTRYADLIDSDEHKDAIIYRLAAQLGDYVAAQASVDFALQALSADRLPFSETNRRAIAAHVLLNDVKRQARESDSETISSLIARIDGEILAALSANQLAELELIRIQHAPFNQSAELAAEIDQAILATVDRFVRSGRPSDSTFAGHVLRLAQYRFRQAPLQPATTLFESLTEKEKQSPDISQISARLTADHLQVKNSHQIWSVQPIEQWEPLPPSIVDRLEIGGGFVDPYFAFCQWMAVGEFLQLAERMRPYGYRPQRVRPWMRTPDDQVVAAVWNRDGRDWSIEWGLDSKQLESMDRRFQEEGKLPSELAACDNSSEKSYVVVWSALDEDAEPRKIDVGVALSGYAQHVSTLRAEGWYPHTLHVSPPAEENGAEMEVGLIFAPASNSIPGSIQIAAMGANSRSPHDSLCVYDVTLRYDNTSESLLMGSIQASQYYLQTQLVEGISPEHMQRLTPRMIAGGYRLIAMDITRDKDAMPIGCWVWAKPRE